MNFTDYAENKLADYFRGQGISFPTSWRIAVLSAASDSSVTEITGSGVTRAVSVRDLVSWAGTQGPGTTLASNGSSKTTSNNSTLSFGTASGSAGTATHIGFFDNSVGGNCWIYSALPEPIVITTGVTVSIAAGQAAFTLGAGGGATDYLINKLIDYIFRGVSYAYPLTVYLSAHLSGGGEMGGGAGYSRVSMASSLAEWSGTQSAGSTAASSGTGGIISNNNIKTFPVATSAWGDIDRLGINDASTAGNQLWLKALNATKTIPLGRALSFNAGTLKLTIA